MSRWRKIGPALILLAACLATGCSREIGPATSGQKVGPAHQPPFQATSEQGPSPTEALIEKEIPAGTPLSVQLQTSVSTVDSHAGDSFKATLDQPIVIKGETLAPRGAQVVGKVTSARTSEGPGVAGYLRLELSWIYLSGKNIPLHTSCIFAKGRSDQDSERGTIERASKIYNASVEANGVNPAITDTASELDVRFSTGRRLRFRLAQALHLPS